MGFFYGENMLDKLVVLGDVHGKFDQAIDICKQFPDKIIISVGDIGIGFRGYPTPPLPDNFKFIRGNHDNPEIIKNHPHFIKDFGMWNDIFVLGGAKSVDQEWRTPMINWWPDEQLNLSERETAYEEYAINRPNIVVCHEAPYCLHKIGVAASITHNKNNEGFGGPTPNDTANLLDRMLQTHMPKLLIHGHWHNPLIYKQWGCVFISLGELEHIDINKTMEYYNIKL